MDDGKTEFPLVVRRPGEEDLPQIAGLIEQVLGKSVAPQHLLHKYFRNPCGSSPMAMALSGGRCVAFMGLLVAYAYVNGNKVTGAQEVDVAVSEDFRNLSVFLQMVAQLKGQIESGDIAFSYGVSNSNTADIARVLLGKTDVAVVPRLVRVVNYGPLFKKIIPSALIARILSAIPNQIGKGLLFFRSRLPAGIKLTEIDRFGPEFDLFSEKLSEAFPVVFAKTEPYLNWRYHPVMAGQVAPWKLTGTGASDVLGFCVLGVVSTNGQKRGRIYELQSLASLSPKIKTAWIRTLLRWFYSRGCDVIDCWSMPGDSMRPLLLSAGFSLRPKGHIRLTFSTHGVGKNQSALEPLKTAQNWSFSMGDTDIL